MSQSDSHPDALPQDGLPQDASLLIVEDEPKIARLMADYLQSNHFAPSIISHGNEVIPWLTQHSPELVLLDVMLPGKDGLTLCREIREQWPKLPIIMVTAKVEEVDRLLGLELGADDYICKPFSPREVVARVKAVLRRLAGTGRRPRFRLNSGRVSVAARDDAVSRTHFQPRAVDGSYVP